MLAVVTIIMGEAYKSISEYTLPRIKKYAEKIGAELIIIDKQLISTTSPHYEKFQIYDLLNKYSRILFIDIDCLIRDDCPNLFEIVPDHQLGIFDLGKFQDHTESLVKAASQYKINIDFNRYNHKYYNTGLMVISRIHKQLFKKPEEELWDFYEQSYINLQIMKNNVEVLDIGYKFNHIPCADVTGSHRLRSYIIHYAGILEQLMHVLTSDISMWESGAYLQMKRHVTIGVGNQNLGDNICAEPVLRYIIENTDKSDVDFQIVATMPELYDHLGVPVADFMEYSPDRERPSFIMNLAVAEDDDVHQHVNPDMMNMIDFLSMRCLRRILPDDQKRVRLQIDPNNLSDFIDILNGVDIQNCVLVHPGKSWPSKTFSDKFWNNLIDSLLNEGLTPVIIGKDMYNKLGLRASTVKIEIKDGVIDTRNLLNHKGLIAAIAVCPILITNDSAPLHIAGAFDNEIILFPSCKHHSLIMPIRNGSRDYKSRVFYKKYIDAITKFDLFMDRKPDITKEQAIDPELDEIVLHINSIKSGRR